MSYSLSPASRAHLIGVHPALSAVVERAIVLTACDFTVMEGVRGLQAQHAALARGVSRTLASKHLRQADGFGHAVDLVPWVGGRAAWDWDGCYAVAAAMHEAAAGEGVKLRWGGVWDRPLAAISPADAAGMKAAHLAYVAAFEAAHPGKRALQDGPHFELL